VRSRLWVVQGGAWSSSPLASDPWETRKAAEIEAAFWVKLVCPVDGFNPSRHVGDDSPTELSPPLPERVDDFFEFLKGRIATSRKYAPAARDYALYPHVMVTKGTKAGRSQASTAHMSHLLDGCGVPPRAVRCTRLADLVNTIDPSSSPPRSA
jgi:hypothetical protein